MMKYRTVEAFYAENEARRFSPESDYGVWWRDGAVTYCGMDIRPKYRVSYVKATGEVYALDLSFGDLEVLAVVPSDQGERYYATLDKILDGWAEVCGQPNSLAWVRERLSAVKA